MIVLGAHVCACFFLIIANNEEYSWLDKNYIKYENIFIKYINALYFAFITMITVNFFI